MYLKDRASTGTVARETAPRSYEVQTPDGKVRRNRRHMVLTDPTERDDDSQYELLNPPTLFTSCSQRVHVCTPLLRDVCMYNL